MEQFMIVFCCRVDVMPIAFSLTMGVCFENLQTVFRLALARLWLRKLLMPLRVGQFILPTHSNSSTTNAFDLPTTTGLIANITNTLKVVLVGVEGSVGAIIHQGRLVAKELLSSSSSNSSMDDQIESILLLLSIIVLALVLAVRHRRMRRRRSPPRQVDGEVDYEPQETGGQGQPPTSIF